MTAKPEYERGYGDGYKWAVHWLHERAKSMNDPHAQAILNTAAFNLGVEGSERMANRFAAPASLVKATKEMARAFYEEIDRQRRLNGWPIHDLKFDGLPENEQAAILAAFNAALARS